MSSVRWHRAARCCYRLLLYGVLTPMLSFAAGPKKPTIVTVAPAIDNQTHQVAQLLVVTFKDAVELADLTADPSKWVIVVIGDDLPNPKVLRMNAAADINVRSARFVILTLPANTLTAQTTSVQVSFEGASQLWSASATAPQNQPFLSAASDKNHADLYLSGLYSPAIHSAAQYTIDVQGKLVKQFGQSRFRAGGTAVVETDKRPSADPDSFLVSGVLQWIPIANAFGPDKRFRGMLVDWNVAGLEFDRKSTTQTFISSPTLELPIRIYPRPKAEGPTATAGLIPLFGLQIGDNLKNAVDTAGSGSVIRGTAGALFTYNKTLKLSFLTKLSFTSNYTVRIPARAEVFTYTQYNSATAKSTDLPTIGTQARHHLKDEMDITFAKPFSLTIKHEYGELPAAFRKIDNSVSVGLTVMFQQRNGAAQQIDPEK